jgi:hypothetical protein
MDDNKDYVYTVAFSPDERFLVSGSNNLVARPVKAVMLAEDFCSMISRNLSQEEWESYVGADIEYEKTCPQQ